MDESKLAADLQWALRLWYVNRPVGLSQSLKVLWAAEESGISPDETAAVCAELPEGLRDDLVDALAQVVYGAFQDHAEAVRQVETKLPDWRESLAAMPGIWCARLLAALTGDTVSALYLLHRMQSLVADLEELGLSLKEAELNKLALERVGKILRSHQDIVRPAIDHDR